MTIAEAFEQRGAQRLKSELIINMVNNGMPAEQIAKYTELDLSFIEQVKEQHDIKH